MTISFHRRGKNEETDEAFDSLRESLDELKEMEEKEFGTSVEGKGDAGLVEAQWRSEDSAALRELEEGEETDGEALRKADELAMLPENWPVERAPKVSLHT